MDAVSPSNSSARTNVSPHSFVPDRMGGWICPHCMTLPYRLRTPDSFSAHQPSSEHADRHFATCSVLAAMYDRTPAVEQSSQYQSILPFHPSSRTLPSDMAWPSVPDYNMNMGLQETFGNRRQSGRDETVPPQLHVSAQLPPQLPMLQPQIYTVSQAHLGYHHTTRQPPHQDVITEYMTPPQAGPVVNKVREAANFLAAECRARAECGSNEEELIMPEDKHIMTDYFYFLVQQLRICRFGEADRKTRGGKRDNLEVGYGGLQCRHCAGKRRARKFFWTDVDRLANSFSEISGHIMKCLECPPTIKAALRQLKSCHHEQMAKMPRGSQKVFFRRVWRRLHQDYAPFGITSGGSGEVISTSSTLADETKTNYCCGEGSAPNQLIHSRRKMSHDSTESATLGVRTPSVVRLAIESDKKWLSDMDCCVRDSLEVFRASVEDVKKYQSCSVKLNQVGIRCTYCASTPRGATGSAIRFPYSVTSLYDKVCEIHRLHLAQCPNCPVGVIHKLSQLEKTTSKSLSSISRQYYKVAAKLLGMRGTPDGIFMQELDTGAIHELDNNAAAGADLEGEEKDDKFPSSSTAASSLKLSSHETMLDFPPHNEITDCRKTSSPTHPIGASFWATHHDFGAKTDSAYKEKAEISLPYAAAASSFELPSHHEVGLPQFSEVVAASHKRKRRSISPFLYTTLDDDPGEKI